MPWRQAGKERRMGGELVRAAAARAGLLAALDLARIPMPVLILAAVVAVLAILALVLLVAVFRTVREFRAAGAGGRRVSAEKSGSHPLTSFSPNGVARDPLNVMTLPPAAHPPPPSPPPPAF